jgi:predicted HicB family RNase H-like nuclease
MEADMKAERERIRKTPVMVRLPENIHGRLKEVAGDNHRSMNTEIIYRLEKALFDPLETQKPAAAS